MTFLRHSVYSMCCSGHVSFSAPATGSVAGSLSGGYCEATTKADYLYPVLPNSDTAEHDKSNSSFEKRYVDVRH